MPTYKNIPALQQKLKDDLMNSVRKRIGEICMNVVRDSIMERVYWDYTPDGINSYDRTYELLDCVTVTEPVVGTKYMNFEIFMDTSKINPYITDDSSWNQHASVENIDVSEMIPLWIEEGTEGSLHDREGAHYMEQSALSLDSTLYKAFAQALRREGWKVTLI